jgi:hypothetical protein
MAPAVKVGELSAEVVGDKVILSAEGECAECGDPAEVRVTMRVGAFREFARQTLDAIQRRA